MRDTFSLDTLILGYTGLPFSDQKEVDAWWNPPTKWVLSHEQRLFAPLAWPRRKVYKRVAIGPARMSRREKERYLGARTSNIITNNGKQQIIDYIGTNGAFTAQFGNYLSLGNGTISAVSGGDIAVVGEYFRQSVSMQYFTGSTQVDMQTTITSASAAGSVTNLGIYGNGASGTLGTGVLETHCLFKLVIPNPATTIIDYVIVIS